MAPITSKFNNKIVDLVFASFKLKEEILNEDREGIRWISLANYDLRTTVDVVKEAVMQQRTAKNILVSCFQKFLGNTDVQVLIKYLYEIYDLVKDQTQNRLVFGTALFLPTQEEYWKLVALFNKECQILNAKMDRPRVNLHRSVMRQMPDDTMEIKPQNWQEFQLGVATGRTLSHEGQECLFRYIRKAFDTVFGDNALTLKSKPPKVICPPSLAQMPEYKNNRFFRQVLEVKGILPRRTRSAGQPRQERLTCTDDRLSGWRHWYIFKQQGPLWSLSSREGALEAHNYLISRSDERPVWEEDVVEKFDDESDDRDAAVMEEDNDSVFEEEARPVPKRSYKKEEKEKEQKDSYESQDKVKNVKDDNKMTTKLLKLARDKVRESEHMLTVADEKMKAYKKEAAAKEAQIVKEKAAVKHWRNIADVKQAEIDKLTADYNKLEASYERVMDRCEELTKDYEDLCEVYGEEIDKPKKQKVSRKFPMRDN